MAPLPLSGYVRVTGEGMEPYDPFTDKPRTVRDLADLALVDAALTGGQAKEMGMPRSVRRAAERKLHKAAAGEMATAKKALEIVRKRRKK